MPRATVARKNSLKVHLFVDNNNFKKEKKKGRNLERNLTQRGMPILLGLTPNNIVSIKVIV